MKRQEITRTVTVNHVVATILHKNDRTFSDEKFTVYGDNYTEKDYIEITSEKLQLSDNDMIIACVAENVIERKYAMELEKFVLSARIVG